MALAQTRRTHCPRGHLYDLVSGGRRRCLQCKRERYAESHPPRPPRQRPARGVPRRATTEPRPTRDDSLTVDELFRINTQVNPDSGCWIWTGTIVATGYGSVSLGGVVFAVHRLSYEHFVGPIPPGLTIDHVKARGCVSRACANPSHLEPVTLAENVLRGDSPPALNKRKTHCPQGHPYDDANTYVNPNTGYRLCRACARARSLARYYKNRRGR